MRYEIKGDNLPVAICYLEQNEQMITERGGMAWMSPNMKMETTTNGGLGRALARKFSGDSIFQNVFTAVGGQGVISFASSFPGEIVPFEIRPGQELIVQKKGFLAAETGVDLSIYFHRRFASGLFGGEGFILQKLSGQGTAFVEFDGSIVEYDLQPGQQIYIDPGHLAAMSTTCQMDIKTVPGVKNVLFGGEGLFHTVVTGPGHVWLQTMPVVNLANEIRAYIPNQNS